MVYICVYSFAVSLVSWVVGLVLFCCVVLVCFAIVVLGFVAVASMFVIV